MSCWDKQRVIKYCVNKYRISVASLALVPSTGNNAKHCASTIIGLIATLKLSESGETFR